MLIFCGNCNGKKKWPRVVKTKKWEASQEKQQNEKSNIETGEEKNMMR